MLQAFLRVGDDPGWFGADAFSGFGNPGPPAAAGRMLVGGDWVVFHEQREGGQLMLTAHGAPPTAASDAYALIENAPRDDSQLSGVLHEVRARLGPFNVLRLAVCHGGEGGRTSLAGRLSRRLRGVRVHGFKGRVRGLEPTALRRVLEQAPGRDVALPGRALAMVHGAVMRVSEPGQTSFFPRGQEVVFQDGAQLPNIHMPPWEQLPGRIRGAGGESRYFAGTMDYFHKIADEGLREVVAVGMV